MNKSKCELCGKEYKNLKQHTTKSHNKKTLVIRDFGKFGDEDAGPQMFIVQDGKEEELLCGGIGSYEDRGFMLYDGFDEKIHEIRIYHTKEVEFFQYITKKNGDNDSKRVYRHNIKVIFE